MADLDIAQPDAIDSAHMVYRNQSGRLQIRSGSCILIPPSSVAQTDEDGRLCALDGHV